MKAIARYGGSMLIGATMAIVGLPLFTNGKVEWGNFILLVIAVVVWNAVVGLIASKRSDQ